MLCYGGYLVCAHTGFCFCLLCRLDKGGVDLLRKVEGIDVPDEGSGDCKGDLLDAMVVGLHMIRSRTIKK